MEASSPTRPAMHMVQQASLSWSVVESGFASRSEEPELQVESEVEGM